MLLATSNCLSSLVLFILLKQCNCDILPPNQRGSVTINPSDSASRCFIAVCQPRQPFLERLRLHRLQALHVHGRSFQHTGSRRLCLTQQSRHFIWRLESMIISTKWHIIWGEHGTQGQESSILLPVPVASACREFLFLEPRKWKVDWLVCCWPPMHRTFAAR